MIIAPIPADEAERLQALRELLILDTAPEERFDRLTAFAADEFDVPIATVTLVDAERQWFKSQVGLAICETSRDASFCAHTIHLSDIMVVEDALRDLRFFDNPLVTGDPFIRFYAGAPLVLASGATVGSFCLIDTKPRTLDEMDLSILRSLRDLAASELEPGRPPP